MNQNQVRAQFKEQWDEAVKENPSLATDAPAKSLAFGMLLDNLCRAGEITQKQYDNMTMEPAKRVRKVPAAPMPHYVYQFKAGKSPSDGSGRTFKLSVWRLEAGKDLELVIKRTDKYVSEWQMVREALKAAKVMPAHAFRENGDLMNATELREAGIAIVESI